MIVVATAVIICAWLATAAYLVAHVVLVARLAARVGLRWTWTVEGYYRGAPEPVRDQLAVTFRVFRWAQRVAVVAFVVAFGVVALLIA